MMDCIACIEENYHWGRESTHQVLIPVAVITVSHWYDLDWKSFSTCSRIGDALQKLISY